VKTKDDVFAELAIKVHSTKAFFSLEDPKSQIYAYIENVVRSRAPHLTLNDLYQEQDAIETSVSERLSGRMKEHGYTIANTLITSIDPAAKVKSAMNAILTRRRSLTTM